MKMDEYSADKRSEVAAEADVQKERREFLEKCGRFAAYATPAVLLLLHGAKSEATVGSLT